MHVVWCDIFWQCKCDAIFYLVLNTPNKLMFIVSNISLLTEINLCATLFLLWFNTNTAFATVIEGEMMKSHCLMAALSLFLTACVATTEPSENASSTSGDSLSSDQPSSLNQPSSALAVSSMQSMSSATVSSSSLASSQSNNGEASSSATVMTAAERGKVLYFEEIGGTTCASCHGDSGEGLPGRAPSPLYGTQCLSCGSPAELVAVIDTRMPRANGHLCTDDCAEDLAAYIYETFIGKPFSLSCDTGIQKVSPMRRLNKVEIANAVDDVFGSGGEAIRELLPDEQSVIGGFATVGSALDTTSDWTRSLFNAALDAADTIVASGQFSACPSQSAGMPLVEQPSTAGECRTTTQCRELYDGATDCDNGAGGICYCGDDICTTHTPPRSDTTSEACFTEAISLSGKRLFRQDLSDDDLARLKTIRENAARDTGQSDAGDKAAVVALLTSPRFVFSFASDDKTRARNLTGPEMADRLALTLWGSVPDAELVDLGASDSLIGAVLENQIDRMLEDERFERFANVFGDAWLGLGGYLVEGKHVGKTDAQWQQLLADMKAETHTFLSHIFKNNLPIDELYTATYSFLNARLQEHYGFPVTGNNTDFVKVDFPADSRRRGLMMQGAILSKAFDGGKTSVVKRGVLPLEAFTCTAPHAPTDPDILDQINEQQSAATTEKGKIEERKQNPCGGCHAVIDPLGWVFTEFGIAGENIIFDPDGDALSTAGELFGQTFSDAHEMVDVITQENKFSSCFANKFLIHSIGRKVSYEGSVEDQCAIDDAIRTATKDGVVGARDLIKSLMRSNIATFSGTVEEQ